MLQLSSDGAEFHQGAARRLIDPLLALCDPKDLSKPGHRIFDNTKLRFLLSKQVDISEFTGKNVQLQYQPVRAIWFDKNPSNNWALGWHQDRTIAVKAPANVDGFGPWSIKQGIHHVEPPFELFSNMITIRIHIDEVTHKNGPLIVALGSHKFEKVEQSSIMDRVKDCMEHFCLAKRGEIWRTGGDLTSLRPIEF